MQRTRLTQYIRSGLEHIQQLSDVRRLGLIVFAVIAVLITWSGVKVISTNHALQKDIATMERQTEIRRLQNRNLEMENRFYETDEYLELEARRNFGKALPGETVWVVPENVAVRYLSEEALAVTEQEDIPETTGARANINAWIDFLLHR